MTFVFRLRARLGLTVKVESPDVELVLLEGPDGTRVVLKALDGQTPLTDSPDIVITGSGYETASDAEQAGVAWWGHVMVGFARLGIGADFGERAPQGGFAGELLSKLRKEMGSQFFNERPGVIVYPADPPAYFLHAQVSGVVGKMGPEVVRAIQTAHERSVVLSDRLRLAYDLYSGSFFQPAADARFLMLAMALETMIERRERASEVCALVDRWIASLADSGIGEPAIQSLRSGLDGLKWESVGQAGRRLAATLNGRTYLEKPAIQFFTYCYTLRSRLAHGRYPRPTRDEVGIAAAYLEKFVGDLLGIALIADFPH